MKKAFIPFVVLLLAQGLSPVKAQYQKTASVLLSKSGALTLDPGTLNAASLRQQLHKNLFTDVSIVIGGGKHTFRVGISDRLSLRGTQQEVYDGYESGNKNRIMLLLSKEQCYAYIQIGEKEYSIAPITEINKAGFITQLKNNSAKFTAPFEVNGKYGIVNENLVHELLTTNIKGKVCELAGPDLNSSKPGNTSKGTLTLYDYNDEKKLGYIGKRDLYLNLYDYDGVTDYDYGRVVNAFSNELFVKSDPVRFADIRLVIIKHKRGESDMEAVIDQDNLPWTDTAGVFIGRFRERVKNKLLFPSLNDYHLLLSRKSWNEGTLGIAYMPGTFGVACTIHPAIPVHEFSHNLGADHTNVSGDLMYPHANDKMLSYHTVSSNIERIQNRVNKVSIKDEILNGTYEPVVKDWNIAEDLVTVSGNSNTVFINQGLTGLLFSGQQMYKSDIGCTQANVYKIKIPYDGQHPQTFFQMRITKGDFDTYMYMLDENGNLIAADDDGGGVIDDGVWPGNLSYLSGWFNANKYYYIIVSGYPKTGSAVDCRSGNFTFKARYGWYTEGWKATEGALTAAPDTSGLWEAPDGSLIQSADFGLGMKESSGAHLSATGSPIELYPVPVGADHVVHIRQSGMKSGNVYTVFNSVGQKVTEGLLTDDVNSSITLPVSLSGMYVLRLTHADGSTATKTFMVQ